MTTHPIAQSLLDQLTLLGHHFAPPRMAQLHVPRRPEATGEHDAEFCAIELEDGAFGLSYVLLGHTLNALLANHGGGSRPLAGADPLALAQGLQHGRAVERAIALAAINALTDSVWRQVGYEPPPAGNSLGDIELTPQDHLGMIGFFPPLVRRVAEAGGRLSVLEMNAEMVTRQRERYSNARIDDAVTGKPFTPELLLELECLSNRSYTGGMKERCRAQDYKNHISGHRESNRSQIVGEVLRVREDGWAEVETKNCFAEGDQLTVIHPSGNRTATLEAMRNQEGVVFDVTQDGPIGVWLPLPSPSHGALLARLI